MAWWADERRARAKEYTTTHWSGDKGNEPDRGEGGSKLQAVLVCQTVGLGMRVQISGASRRTVLEICYRRTDEKYDDRDACGTKS